MLIRRAVYNDIAKINDLLHQVLDVHHKGRPDIFKDNTTKYTNAELAKIIDDDNRPVFVADVDGEVVGYAFCIFQQHLNSNILTDIKTLYIDDLCVDKTKRGLHIGTELYNFVLNFAKNSECYNITLNVWSCNSDAIKFYESLGLKPQKVGMEKIL